MSEVDFLHKRIIGNPTFESFDIYNLDWLVKEIVFWTKDIQSLNERMPYLEKTVIYFAEKYATRERLAKNQKDRTYWQQTQFYRSQDGGSHKGELLKAAVHLDKDYQIAVKRHSAAEELSGIFEKLNWMVIRKSMRIEIQGNMNQRNY